MNNKLDSTEMRETIDFAYRIFAESRAEYLTWHTDKCASIIVGEVAPYTVAKMQPEYTGKRAQNLAAMMAASPYLLWTCILALENDDTPDDVRDEAHNAILFILEDVADR